MSAPIKVVVFFFVPKVHSLLYSGIPCILLVVINVVFLTKLCTVRKKVAHAIPRRGVHKHSKSSRLNATVIALTAIYVVCTVPAAYVEFNLFEMLKTEGGRVFMTVSDTLAFSYHALNFFIIYKLNHRFKRNLKRLFVKLFKSYGTSTPAITTTTIRSKYWQTIDSHSLPLGWFHS